MIRLLQNVSDKVLTRVKKQSCFHDLSWPSDDKVLVFKKLLGRISSTAKHRWANKEDEEEKQNKEEEN